MTVLPGRASESPAQIRFNLRLHLGNHGDVEPLQYTAEGSEGQAILDELASRPGDLVVKKYRSSGFWGTNLDLLLRSNGIKSIVVTGCTTEGCVESTARDALFNDYYVVISRGLRGKRRPSAARGLASADAQPFRHRRVGTDPRDLGRARGTASAAAFDFRLGVPSLVNRRGS